MTQPWEHAEIEQGDDFIEIHDEVHDDDLSMPSFTRSGRKRPAMLLATVAMGSILAIVTMRSLTGGLGQVMADTGLESAINGFLRNGTAQKKDVDKTAKTQGNPFADLVTNEYALRQVQPEDLRSNPFVTPWSMTGNNVVASKNVALSKAQQRSLRRTELQGHADDVQVQSVMTGSRPLATINDLVVRVGEEVVINDIDATCLLRAVTSDGVQLEVIDEELGVQVTCDVPLRRN